MAEGVERSEENRCSRKRGREREAQDEAQDEVSTNASLAAAKRTRLPAAAAASILMASKISQLTIFYNGNVCVYDDVPPEKAQAIMLIAAAASSAATQTVSTSSSTAASSSSCPKSVKGPGPAYLAASGCLTVAAGGPPAGSPVLTRSPSLQSSSAAMGEASGAPQAQQLLPGAASSLCQLHAELPLARRNSLQRFLEKRRDRLVSKALQSPMKDMNSPDSGLGSDASTPAALYL